MNGSVEQFVYEQWVKPVEEAHIPPKAIANVTGIPLKYIVGLFETIRKPVDSIKKDTTRLAPIGLAMTSDEFWEKVDQELNECLVKMKTDDVLGAAHVAKEEAHKLLSDKDNIAFFDRFAR